MKSDNRMRLIAIGMALALLGLVMAGCGKKGDPIPPRIKPVAAMTASHRDSERMNIGAGQEDCKIMNSREDHYERFQL
jgi:predicted small lipoprotein YifL